MSNDGAVNFFLDSVDDVLLPDQIPSFEGGQFSNLRANLLQQNQSKLLVNTDIDRLGKIRTRRGTIQINTVDGPPSGVAGKVIQGLCSYQTSDVNYVVAANNKKLWKWNGSAWVQIALGGVLDGAEMLIYREGKIDNLVVVPPAENGYPAGTTVLKVKEVGYVGVTAPPSAQGGILGVGEKLYFTNNLRTDYWEYTIKAVSGGPPVTQITLEEPGLVFDVKDSWKFVVARPATNVGAHLSPVGTPYTGTLTISGYTGVVNHGESFVIKSENKKHTVDTFAPAAPTSTTSLTGSWGSLQTDWVADTDDVPVIFAQGQDMLFFSDGTGPIYGWQETTAGGILMNISSHSILDDFNGNFNSTRTTPPQDVTVLLWFQNRLIASGIASEPDAIYFSDFFDATSWDKDYQKVRIGGGESDPITGCLAWTDLNMLVFKKNSCYLINLDPTQNPNPDDPTLLVASFAVKQLHKLIGCPAPRTAVQVGGGSTTPGSDVLFLDGDKKVHSIRRVIAAETQQEVGQAVSLPIQDVLDTINLQNIGAAVAMYHNEHYILGFPSTRGLDGGALYPNGTVAYNMLTQSWCGVWGWSPTCFARRTDLGAYSKLIFGDWRVYPGGSATGRVLQWMDDIGLDDETETSYQDFVIGYGGSAGTGGQPVRTAILTRAFTGGDMYSYKTGLNVEFEFDESVCGAVTVKVYLDKVVQDELIAVPFSTLTEAPVRLTGTGPILPFYLPNSPSFMRRAFDLQRYGQWRELQFFITTTAEKLALRSIRISYFMDTMKLQTMPTPPGHPFELAVILPPSEFVVTGEPIDPTEIVTGDDGLNVVMIP